MKISAYLMNAFIFLCFLVLPLSSCLANKVGTKERLTIEECIKVNSPQVIQLKSLSNVFMVEYIQNSPSECINPNFPSIKISSLDEKVVAWIHVIHSDSKDLKYKKFVDSQTNIFPFYTLDKEFFDAPLWNFTLFKKPLTYWRGHAYAFGKVDNKIKLLGGIKWGFNLRLLSLKPETIPPEALTLTEWEGDLDIITNSQAGGILNSLSIR